MASPSQVAFVRGQGFRDAEESECASKYNALMFQPRLIGILVAAGIVLQRADLFLALSALALWSAAVPPLSPFDGLYNRLVAAPRNLPRLSPARPPRRFAQGMAGTFLLLIGISLLLGWQTAAWVVEAMMAGALVALLFGRFCVGSYIFDLLFSR